MIRNKIATRDWKPSWPSGIWREQHGFRSCRSGRGYRWPGVFRINRFDAAWRSCI